MIRLIPSLLVSAMLTGTPLAALASTQAQTGKPARLAPLSNLSPTSKESHVEVQIADILMHHHYGKRALNDTMSKGVLSRYLKGLDPNRSYFLQRDIDGFKAKYENKLDEAISQGNLAPAFAIYNVYQERVESRIAFAFRLLDKQPDFNVKEQYIFDRSDAPWAKDIKSLDNLWEKRVKNDAIGLLLSGKTWEQTAAKLKERYSNFLHRTRQVTKRDVFDAYMNAFANSMDPHTDYFSPQDSQQFQIQMSLKLEGIGAALQTEDEYTKIDRILPGGPAEKSNLLHPDDRITAVGQGNKGPLTDVVGWRLDDVVQLIRGPSGSVVRLQILPAGAPPGSPEKTIRLVRSTIKLEEQAAKDKVIQIKRDGRNYPIGVIRVPSFYLDFRARIEGAKNYASTTRDVARLVRQLESKHVRGIVLDLRNNGGGSLEEATELTGLFINTGPVVQVKDTDGDLNINRDEDTGELYKGPLAVLVNRFSASASEIFAGALQDYKRAVIVGQTTYGKGTVQTLVDLNRVMDIQNDVGQLKLTIGKFYRVTGASTQLKGVTPDIAMPSPIDPAEFGEDTESSALPWDRISAVPFTLANPKLAEEISILKTKHLKRIEKDPAYALYLSEIKEYQKQNARKSVSLLLAERRMERQQRDAQRLAQANAWRKLQDKPPLGSLTALNKSGGKAAILAPVGDGTQSSSPDILLDETAQIVLDLSKLAPYRDIKPTEIAVAPPS